MGKKVKGKKGPAAEISEEVAQKVAAKKQEGDNALGAKKYSVALAAYQAAIKELPENHPEVAALHTNKAAIHLMERKFKEAVRECNLALAIEGNHAKALLRRSKAKQELGMFKDSLSDMQKVNASPEKNSDTEAAEAHLKDLVAGRTSPNTNAAPVGNLTAAQQQQHLQGSAKERAKQQLRQHMLSCKVVCEDEIRMVHMRYGLTYYELRHLMREKWPGVVHFKIFYHDKDDDWILITCARDVIKSMNEVLVYTQKLLAGGSADTDMQVPKYKLEKCKKADVPAIPKEEIPRDEMKSKAIVKSTDPLAEETVVELDDWLIDFANLFREHLGVDPDKHVDVHREGWEQCTKAMDSAIKLDEGRKLFTESLDRFRDVTCIGLYNWGNVHVCLAKKIAEDAAANNKTPDDIREEFDKECDQAMLRYNQALEYNPNYVDGLLGIAQIQIERAKLAAGLLIPPLEPVDQEELKDADPETLEEVNKESAIDANAKLKIALKKVDKETVLKAEGQWKEVYATFAKAADVIPEDKREITKQREASRADDIVGPEPTDQTHLLANQVQIMWGNALYDQSQLWGGMEIDGWKEMVLEAQKRFTGATCPEKDVLQALRNHIRAADLDLPPEEKPATSSDSEKSAPTAKGLPALEKPKKKTGKK